MMPTSQGCTEDKGTSMFTHSESQLVSSKHTLPPPLGRQWGLSQFPLAISKCRRTPSKRPCKISVVISHRVCSRHTTVIRHRAGGACYCNNHTCPCLSHWGDDDCKLSYVFLAVFSYVLGGSIKNIKRHWRLKTACVWKHLHTGASRSRPEGANVETDNSWGTSIVQKKSWMKCPP